MSKVVNRERYIRSKEFKGTFDNPNIEGEMNKFFEKNFIEGKHMLLSVEYSTENMLGQVNGKNVRRTVSSALIIYSENTGSRVDVRHQDGDQLLVSYKVAEVKSNIKEPNIDVKLNRLIEKVGKETTIYFDTLYSVVQANTKDGIMNLGNALIVFAERLN